MIDSINNGANLNFRFDSKNPFPKDKFLVMEAHKLLQDLFDSGLINSKELIILGLRVLYRTDVVDNAGNQLLEINIIDEKNKIVKSGNRLLKNEFPIDMFLEIDLEEHKKSLEDKKSCDRGVAKK